MIKVLRKTPDYNDTDVAHMPLNTIFNANALVGIMAAFERLFAAIPNGKEVTETLVSSPNGLTLDVFYFPPNEVPYDFSGLSLFLFVLTEPEDVDWYCDELPFSIHSRNLTAALDFFRSEFQRICTGTEDRLN